MSWDANVDIVIGFIGFSTSNILSWLVVWTILKTMSQWEGWHPIYEMENKIHVPKHQPDIKIIKPCNNSKLTIGDSVGLGLPHLGFFTKKGNRETHWFHQWFSLCFTHWISGCEKKTSTGNVFYSFLFLNTCNCSSTIQFWGEKPSGNQTWLENHENPRMKWMFPAVKFISTPCLITRGSHNWALSIYNFPTKTFIILYLSRIFHFKEDVFPTTIWLFNIAMV